MTGCPQWCRKTGSHDIHARRYPCAEDVSVSIILDGAWDEPRLLVAHYRTLKDSSNVLLPLHEAADMAKLMAALGHKDIAALITQAAEAAKEDGHGAQGD